MRRKRQMSGSMRILGRAQRARAMLATQAEGQASAQTAAPPILQRKHSQTLVCILEGGPQPSKRTGPTDRVGRTSVQLGAFRIYGKGGVEPDRTRVDARSTATLLHPA